MDIGKLNSECCSFKNAILKTDKNNLSIALKEFPYGSCGWCNDLLLYHFKKINFPSIQDIYYIYASTNNFTHAWIEIDGIIIDLTLSQFHKKLKKVIFYDKKFHRKFKIKSRDKIIFSEIEDFLISSTIEENYKNLVSDYFEIMKNY